MSKQLIAVLPGDGVGPEVIAQATRVLELYRDRRGLPLDLWHLDLGADRYLKDGTTYPEETRKRIATDVKKTLQSAIANAENNHGLDVDDLIVSEAYVGKAFVIKRFHARARGRAGRIEKPFSNLTVIVRQVEAKA